MSGLEKKELVRAVMDLLESLPGCVAVKRWGTPAALVEAEPDISVLIRGRHFELSVRDAGARPTGRERERAEAWKCAGATMGTVASMADLRRFLEAYGIG